MRASVSACGRFLRCSAASSANRSSTSSLFSPELAKALQLELADKTAPPLGQRKFEGRGQLLRQRRQVLVHQLLLQRHRGRRRSPRVCRAPAPWQWLGRRTPMTYPRPFRPAPRRWLFWGSGAPSSTLPSWASDSVCAICAAILRCPSRRRKPGMEATTASKDSRASVAHFFWLIVGWFGLRSGKRCVKNSFQYIFTAKTACFYLCCSASL